MQRVLFIYFFILFYSASYAQQLSKQDEQFADSIMNANYPADKPGAVLLIAKNGEPIFRKAYGLASIELNVPNKPEYIFAIGAMSKQFTAVCVLKLAQEGKLNLQDDITKYLSQYNAHGRHITIENLLTHTSGIISFENVKGVIAKSMLEQSHEELLNDFMNDSLLFESGTDWSYSTSNYVVAGLIVEQISGISLTNYLQQNIFNPLGMSHTYIGTHDSTIINAANGYESVGNDTYKSPYNVWTWNFGARGIITNADDLLKWDNALYTEKIIKKEWLQKAWIPFVLPDGQITNYGFGWTINNYNGLQYIEHSGGMYGFKADGIRVPSQQLYVVILSNTTSVWVDYVASTIALRLTGQTLSKPSSVHLHKKTLEGYAGVYVIHRAGGTTAADSASGKLYRYFVVKNDTLFEQFPDGSNYPLLNVSKDIFVYDWGNPHYQFHRDEKSKVISVEIHMEPIQGGLNELKLKTNLPLPKAKQAVTINRNKLQLLTGKYDFGGGNITPVILEENRIYVQLPGGEKSEIFAENETHFFFHETWTIEFIKTNGKITGMIINVGAKVVEGKKIERRCYVCL